jgi:hypothetical protein
MATEFYATDNRPYSYSRRWRMKYNSQRHHTAIGYRQAEDEKLKLVMGFKHPNYYYDEYLPLYYSTNALGGPFPFREIPGILITPELGDTENDYLLDKVVVDMQYDSVRYGFYTYDAVSNADPTVVVDVRSPAYHNQTPTKRVDLVALNQTAMPSLNPFISVRQAPADTDISSDDVAAYRESIALVSPMIKYRRMRLEFRTLQKVTTMRSFQVIFTEYPRRTWG